MPTTASLRRLWALAVCSSILWIGMDAARAGEPPQVEHVSPTPGFVLSLTSIEVRFSKPVQGVQAGDLLINGVPASSLRAADPVYTFAFPQPAYGAVDVAWAPLHQITDLEAQRFDGGAAGSTWAYQLVDPEGPALSRAWPQPGTVLRRLAQVELTFTEPVRGVDPRDLKLNGVTAVAVVGVGAGPYLFTFSEVDAGPARVEWAADPGIVSDDEVAIPFQRAAPWDYTVDPKQVPPRVVINEILADNQTGMVDEDGDAEDWIELRNEGRDAVDLGGWSLSVDRDDEGQWVFPPTVLKAGEFLVVWASGKDRRELSVGQRYHTSFKLNANGDTLRLYGPELPRSLVDEMKFPEQAPDHSYGRASSGGGAALVYFAEESPGTSNSSSTVNGRVRDVHFSVERGFFNAAFNLSLACPSPGSEIRYTLNGSPPSATNGIVYSSPIRIETTRVVRAAAFAPNQLPSPVRTHTYLMNLGPNRRLLPVVSLVTATNNLYGRNGIMESNPRNTTKHGPAWERPVSIEWVRPEDNGGFQLDAGVRVAGGDYIRQRYNYRSSSPPEGKYSFRLYFRGEYGPGRLEYPVFPGSTVASFNSLHLRAGMNDPSNPFIRDEFVRELSLDVGIPACHGTFVYLFLNGVYKGLYNPCERVDDDFLQAYHGGGDFWDVMGPNNQAIRGDTAAWNQLRTAARKDLTVQTNYLEVARRMDLPNFIDYLLPLIWADNDDWPHNNTRAAREKLPDAPFRFYPWDAEFAFSSHSVSYDTIARTLSNLSPPWGTSDYQAMFNSLKKSPEFRLLFADRVHRAFFNDGPLTDARIQSRYDQVKARVAGSIPGFNNLIGNWITARRPYVTNSFARAGFLASSNAPQPSQFGGRVAPGYPLRLQNRAGTIYVTTDGTDPRTPFTSQPSASATAYDAPIVITRAVQVKARSLQDTNWSALVDLAFAVTQAADPIRITEIMFNPPGGDAYEFIELQNTSGLAVDVSGFSFEGIQFRFPAPFPLLQPAERLVLANDSNPGDFRKRYPQLAVAGWFAGALANGGERIVLIDASGRTVTSVEYKDGPPWPRQADGAGASLELKDPQADASDPANWQASAAGGSPGEPPGSLQTPAVRLSELQAGTSRDWIELANPGSAAIDLAGWSLSDNSDPRRFVVPSGVTIPPGGFVVFYCGAQPGQPLAVPFNLNRTGETLALYDPNTNRVDAFTFGSVVDGLTLGFTEGAWRLCEPTREANNRPAVLGSLNALRINEFMAAPETGSDWIELHNLSEQPLAAANCTIVTSNGIARVRSANYIAAGGFLLLWADHDSGADHLDLKLPSAGGFIRLLGPDGQELDQVTYDLQEPGVSFARLPDGTGSFQKLTLSASPGRSNYLLELGNSLRITEVMARSGTEADWFELENRTSTTLNPGEYTLGLLGADGSLQKYSLTGSAALGAGERVVAYCGSAPSAPGAPAGLRLPEYLPDEGATLFLLDSAGRTVDRVEYGPQLIRQSVGRSGEQWTLLAEPSPGRPNGAPASLDSGSSLRLNEWLAGGGGTNDFVELYNPANAPVDLTGWILTDDPSLSGSTNGSIGPLSFIDGRGFLRLKADGSTASRAGHLPFQLDLLGETIRLLSPSGTVVDSVDYLVQQEGTSEGRFPDGAEQIAQFPYSATPGAPNALQGVDSDADGMDDAWELAYDLDPKSAADATLDSDHDGVVNLVEYRTGTDPSDPASAFRVFAIASEGQGARIQFEAEPTRAYRIEYATDLTAQAWQTLAEVSAGDHRRTMEVADPAPTDQQFARFYRVILVK